MDSDLTRWLAALLPLDESDSALFSALSRTSPRSTSSCSSTVGDDLDAPEQRLLTVDGVSPTDAAVGSEPRQSAQQQPPKKRKKRGTWRAKDEIERLRQAVVDLEAVIALRRRHGTGSRQKCASDYTPSSSAGIEIWKDVAARQFQQLRDSRRENQQLHIQLQQQQVVAKNLARLIERARVNLQSQGIYRNPTPLDEAMLAFKRQELLAAVHCGFPSLEYVLRDSLLRQPGAEGRAMKRITDPRDPSIQPGAMLMQAQACRLVPSDGTSLGDELWAQSQDTAMGQSKYELQFVERSAQHYLVVNAFELPTPHGPAIFRFMTASARFRSGSRDVTVTAGSFWPDASAPANVQSSGFDMKAWTVVQPHAASADVSEVLFHAQCSRIVTPSGITGANLTPPQAAMLGELVAGAQTYVLDSNDRQIDDILLQAPSHQL